MGMAGGWLTSGLKNTGRIRPIRNGRSAGTRTLDPLIKSQLL